MVTSFTSFSMSDVNTHGDSNETSFITGRRWMDVALCLVLMMSLLVGAFRLRVYWKMPPEPASGITDQAGTEISPPDE